MFTQWEFYLTPKIRSEHLNTQALVIAKMLTFSGDGLYYLQGWEFA